MLQERLSFEREVSLLVPDSWGEFEQSSAFAFLSFPHVLFERYDRAKNALVKGRIKADPSLLTTDFYDSTQGATAKDPTLQAKLDAILKKAPYKSWLKDIAVAVVDLSGTRKFKPVYAAHNDRMNFYAASTGKVTGMLAAYQLRADAQDFCARNPAVKDLAGIVSGLAAEWLALGIPAKDHPDIANVLEVAQGLPITVRVRKQLTDRFADISKGNMNGSTAFVLLKFPYVASVLLAYGLFSRVDQSGQWARTGFGKIKWIPWNRKGSVEMSIPVWGKGNPFPKVPSHSVSAASITQYMTLAAQGRLIGPKTSAAILTHLNTGGCFPGVPAPDVSSLSSGTISVKCGLYNGNIHMPLHFKDGSGPREFVITIMSRNYTWSKVAPKLWKELLTLVP